MIDLASVIRPGDGILWGQACAEPRSLVGALVAQRAALSGCSVFLGASYSGLVKPEHADHLRLSGYAGTGSNRALADAGVLEILPAPYSRLGSLIREKRIAADVVMVQVSPPNARGEYSLGLGVEYVAEALRVARAVIGEVNDRVPWTHTDAVLRDKDFALKVETSVAPIELPAPPFTEQDRAIAQHAAALVPERATLETGIGSLPNAVLCALAGRRDLRVHSGAICDGVVDLDPRLCVGGALIGSQRLFDWARENPAVRLRSSDHTHCAAVLGGIERFVAINSAVEVDFTGQVNGEVARASYVGAVGGALDFARAANQSPGGVSIIVLPAARVVERLSGPVSIPRSEAAVFVTERGVADLRGCTLKEREKRMRAISGTP
ncbi:MAG: acetyl-CoA hydrolase/transferase family protein [Betaproteobacteria bacterium]